MGAVGGNRHYTGGGLGQEGAWACPSCGAENLGAISQGCERCGAGRPGHRVDAAPPTPARSEPPNAATLWIQHHPEATLAQAFTAGYVEGYREARRQQLLEKPIVDVEPEWSLNAEDKQMRTMIAALELFRDQVLIGNPEEVTTGEWLSAEDVTALVAVLKDREARHE